MNGKRVLAVGLVAMGLVPLACGKGDDDDSPEDEVAATEFSEVPELLAAAYCDALAECMPAELIAGWLGTRDCDTYMLKSLQNGLIDAVEVALEEGTVIYDGSKVMACLDEIRHDGCAPNVYHPACELALAGTVASDGDCSQDAECIGDRVCLVDGLCPGQCSPRRANGDRCDRDDECREGSLCSNAVCTALLGPGEECEEGGVECERGYLCLGASANEGRTGTCRSTQELFTAAEGDPCDIQAELCEPGAFCAVSIDNDTVTWTCLPPAPSGGACKLAAPDMCPPGEYCAGLNADVGVVKGICSQLPTGGDDCSLGRCAAEHVCVQGVCRELEPNGEDCSTRTQCYSGYCDEVGVCAPNTPCAP